MSHHKNLEQPLQKPAAAVSSEGSLCVTERPQSSQKYFQLCHFFHYRKLFLTGWYVGICRLYKIYCLLPESVIPAPAKGIKPTYAMVPCITIYAMLTIYKHCGRFPFTVVLVGISSIKYISFYQKGRPCTCRRLTTNIWSSLPSTLPSKRKGCPCTCMY